jgi:Ras of Complex, Roc, domain of DAPkinase
LTSSLSFIKLTLYICTIDTAFPAKYNLSSLFSKFTKLTALELTDCTLPASVSFQPAPAEDKSSSFASEGSSSNPATNWQKRITRLYVRSRMIEAPSSLLLLSLASFTSVCDLDISGHPITDISLIIFFTNPQFIACNCCNCGSFLMAGNNVTARLWLMLRNSRAGQSISGNFFSPHPTIHSRFKFFILSVEVQNDVFAIVRYLRENLIQSFVTKVVFVGAAGVGKSTLSDQLFPRHGVGLRVKCKPETGGRFCIITPLGQISISLSKCVANSKNNSENIIIISHSRKNKPKKIYELQCAGKMVHDEMLTFINNSSETSNTNNKEWPVVWLNLDIQLTNTLISIAGGTCNLANASIVDSKDDHVIIINGTDAVNLELGCSSPQKQQVMKAMLLRKMNKGEATDAVDVRDWQVDKSLLQEYHLHDKAPESTLSTWDFAGQLAFSNARAMFLSHRSVFVVVFDASNPNGFVDEEEEENVSNSKKKKTGMDKLQEDLTMLQTSLDEGTKTMTCLCL